MIFLGDLHQITFRTKSFCKISRDQYTCLHVKKTNRGIKGKIYFIIMNIGLNEMDRIRLEKRVTVSHYHRRLISTFSMIYLLKYD